ncbi:MAG: hypothetical protein WCQ57_12460 [Verrucomicrobiota bacterium]
MDLGKPGHVGTRDTKWDVGAFYKIFEDMTAERDFRDDIGRVGNRDDDVTGIGVFAGARGDFRDRAIDGAADLADLEELLRQFKIKLGQLFVELNLLQFAPGDGDIA